jgi:hypothetical protein
LTSFLALYRGETIATAQIVAVAADPTLVADFAKRMLDEPEKPAKQDAVLGEVEQGRRQALRAVCSEAGE